MREGRTPDFRVFNEGQLCFYVEVKSLHGEDPLDLALAGVDDFEIAVMFRNDPIFNRLTSAVHESVKQFDAVNPAREYPNVLALVNYDQVSNIGDLLGVLTGRFFADDGTQDVIYGKFAAGRIAADAIRIDLYIWRDGDGETRYLYTEGSRHRDLLTRVFGTDPT